MKVSSAVIALVVSNMSVTTAFTTTSTVFGKNNNNAMKHCMSSTIDNPTTVATSSSSSSSTDQEYESAKIGLTTFIRSQTKDNDQMYNLLNHFSGEYLDTCQKSVITGNTPNDNAEAASKRMLDVMKYGSIYGTGENKYKFGVTHKALLGTNPSEEDGNTIDFYQFGCDFFRPAMDVPNSVILGRENIDRAMRQVRDGENVVFLANHQSEADPQVMSVLLEVANYGKEARDMTYVAGHKVTTDPLAVPFSMGRNLICIHSKKHINADPETKPLKQRQNLQAMNAMLGLMKAGGCMLWVAPSGGRDRRDVETGEVPIAKFDSKTIDMFRLMGNKSKVPTHYYSLSMLSYDLCPPPDYVKAGTGEERNVRFVPVGIAVGEELKSVGGVETRHLFSEDAERTCQEGYQALIDAVKKNMGE